MVACWLSESCAMAADLDHPTEQRYERLHRVKEALRIQFGGVVRWEGQSLCVDEEVKAEGGRVVAFHLESLGITSA